MINKWFLLNGPHRLRNGLLLAMVIFITGWLAFKRAYQYSLNDREKVMVTSLLQHPKRGTLVFILWRFRLNLRQPGW